MLCVSSGGTNTSAACLSLAEAQAINKIWYGQTTDGSIPAPSIDNWLSRDAVAESTVVRPRAWHRSGRCRRTRSVLDRIGAGCVEPAESGLCLAAFTNATGNGTDRWKTLSYSGLADALLQGVALDASFGGVNTDNPDLSIFRNRGGKLLTYHGLADQLVPAQGSINYYARVAATMGSVDNVQQFDRLFLVPGLGHCGNIGSIDTGNPAANPPLPAPGQLFNVLTDWVENGVAPAAIVVSTSAGTARSRPLCMYPSKLVYLGGDVNDATSFRCQ
jgi:feruloyl esterase